jgi:hypothetical protein
MQTGSEFVAGDSFAICLSPPTMGLIRLLKPCPLDISARSQQIINSEIRIILFTLRLCIMSTIISPIPRFTSLSLGLVNSRFILPQSWIIRDMNACALLLVLCPPT